MQPQYEHTVSTTTDISFNLLPTSVISTLCPAKSTTSPGEENNNNNTKNNQFTLLKKTIEALIEFLMVLMETVMVPVILYW